MDRLDIMYEDRSVLVLRKPAGTAVQTARLAQRDMVSMAKNYLASGGNRNPYVGVVHRLDQPVEGLLVMAKTPEAAAFLSRQADFQGGSGRRMEKEYLAVVRLLEAGGGKGLPGKGRLRDMLVRDGRSNLSAVVPEGTPGAKYSELEYEIQQTVPEGPQGRLGLARIRLLTGRHHQIRVQMAHAGMPLYGDRKYGGDGSCPPEARLALCACRLAFAHPEGGAWMEFACVPRNPVFQMFRLRE